MDQVVIGMDPHKRSVTIEARDTREVLRAKGRFGTDNRQYQAKLKVAGQWPERAWAVEGAKRIGRPVAQRLLADGERVLGLPEGSLQRQLDPALADLMDQQQRRLAAQKE